MANRFARYVEQAPANRFAKYSQLEQDEPARTPDTSFFREPVNVGGRVGVGSADSVGGAELESDGFNLAALDSINVVPRGVGRLAQTGALAAGLGRDVLAESQTSDTISPFGILLRRALGGAQPKETKGLLAAEEISRDLQRNIDERFPKPQAQSQTERELSQATGVMDTLGALVRNPVGSMQLAGESLASSLPAIRAAGIVAGSGLASGASATSAGEEFDNEFAQFQQTPMFEALRRAIGDENVAKYAEREKARRIQQSLIGSTVGGAATAGITSRIGLNPIDQAIAGRAGVLSSRVPATIRETAGEAFEGGGTQAVTNLFTGADPLQDVATSATMEAALGGLTAAPVDMANAGSRVAGLLSDIGDIGTQAADLTRQAQARATTDRILGRTTPPQTPQEAQTDAGAGIAEAAIQNALAARPVQPAQISPVATNDMRENDELDRLLVGALGGVEDGQTVSDQLRPNGDPEAGVRSTVGSVPIDLPDGTYFIPGDPAAIRQRLADAGVEWRGMERTIDGQTGVRFGANTRGQVLGVLGGVREVNAGAVSGDASSAEPLGTGRSSSNVDVSGAAESRSTLGAQAGQGGGIPAASSAQGLGLDEGAAAALAGRPDGLLQNRAVSSPTQAEAAVDDARGLYPETRGNGSEPFVSRQSDAASIRDAAQAESGNRSEGQFLSAGGQAAAAVGDNPRAAVLRRAEAAVDAQFTLEELTKAAPELESALSRGMLPHIDVATAGNGTSYYAKAVGTIDTDRRLRLSPTAEERKAAQQAAADIELADSQEERDAAKVRLREVLRPAAERAVSAALSPTQRTDGAVRDDILSALPSVQDQSPAQRVSAQSLGADYTDRLLSLMGARKSGAMTEAEREEYTALLEQDRETGKVGGRPMVGIGNKTAYVDALMQGKLMPVQVFLDADNFKALNDKFGHDVGDDAIRLIADVVRAEFGDGNVFHRGGDEFLTQGMTQEEVDAKMARVQDYLARVKMELPLSDGRTATLTGVGVSYGTGANEKAADDSLKQDKQRRKDAGLRFDRREGDDAWRVGSESAGAGTETGRTDSRDSSRAAAEGVGDVRTTRQADAGGVGARGDSGNQAQPESSDAQSAGRADGVAGLTESTRTEQAESGLTVAEFNAELARAYDPRFPSRLARISIIAPTWRDVPQKYRDEVKADGADIRLVAGFVASDGTIVLIPGNMQRGEGVGVTIHEVGVHAWMAKNPAFRELLSDFKAARSRIPAVEAAFRRAESVADRDKNGNLTAAAKATLDEEAFAYYVEQNWNAKSPLMTRIKDAIARLLNRLGIPTSGITDALMRQALDGMVQAARESADAATRGAVTVRDGKIVYHKAWHGSPHDFDKFRLDDSTIGTGEGAQAFGHGLYFAGREELGEHYRSALSGRSVKAGGKTMSHADFIEAVVEMAPAPKSLESAVRSQANEAGIAIIERGVPYRDYVAKLRSGPYARMYAGLADAIESMAPVKNAGRLYEVELAPQESDYLDWDAPLSEQSSKVQQSVYNLLTDLGVSSTVANYYASSKSGADVYREISRLAGGDKAASTKLRSERIPGIRYLDGSSRGGKTGWRVKFKNGQYSGKVFDTKAEADAAVERGEYNMVDRVEKIDDLSRNYVIFDDSQVEVKAKYSRRVQDGRIRRTVAELTNAADSMRTWRDWYDRHDQTLQDVFGDDAALFQKLLSATSQAASVPANIGLALKAYRQLLSGEPFVGYLPAVIKNLERVAADEALRGQKISEYGNANEGSADAIAVDRHIAMLFFNTKSPNRKQVASAKARIRAIAERLGWQPREVQAALWAYNQTLLGTAPEDVKSYDKLIEAQRARIDALRSSLGRGQDQGAREAGGTIGRDAIPERDSAGSREQVGGKIAKYSRRADGGSVPRSDKMLDIPSVEIGRGGRAPAGGIYVSDRFYDGGEFLPEEYPGGKSAARKLAAKVDGNIAELRVRPASAWDRGKWWIEVKMAGQDRFRIMGSSPFDSAEKALFVAREIVEERSKATQARGFMPHPTEVTVVGDDQAPVAKFSRRTITIDGTERPTTDSTGKAIHPTEEGIRNFWRWFSPSPSQLLDGFSVSEVSGLKRDTEALADFIESQAGLSESDRFAVIPPSVFAHVAGAVNNDEILNAVVRSLPVDVVDFLASKKLSPKQVFNDPAVLKDVFSTNPTSDVALAVNPARIAEIAVRVVANAGAKITGLANGALERNAAMLADKSDPVLGAHVRKSAYGDLGIIAGFGESKVVDEQGRPLVVFHGTRDKFDAFADGTGNFTADTSVAQSFAGDGDAIPAYLSIKNPLRVSDPGFWTGRKFLNQLVEIGALTDAAADQWYERSKQMQGEYSDKLKSLTDLVAGGGYDGFVYNNTFEGGGDSFMPFAPTQIKSAESNTGSFSPTDKRIAYSRRTPRTAEQAAALAKAGMPEDNRTLAQRGKDYIAGQWTNLKSLVSAGDAKQSVFDRFHRMSAIEQDLGIPPERSAYISARLAAGLPSIMEGVMMYGAPKWENGVLTVDDQTVGLLDALKPVKDDVNAWLGWMVGRRARALKAQGRENLMTDDDIAALLSLANGRDAEFQDAALKYLRIKNAILDVAEKAGLIDPAGRAVWDSVEYIPFYRQDEADGDTIGPGTRQGLAGQNSGIRSLKGGKQNLADPLGNIVRNFTRLIDASLKNSAMLEAVDEYGDTFFEKVPMSGTFERVPLSQVKKVLLDRGVPQSVIDQMPQGTLTGLTKLWAIKPPTDDDVVRVMRNGKAEYYRVPDKALLASLTAFRVPAAHWVVSPFKFAKKLLTVGVTTTLEFMGGNFIRDSASSWIISDDKFRLGWDSVKGIISPLMDDTAQKEMMFAGGSFIGGQFYSVGSDEATANAIRRALRDKGLKSKDIEAFIGTIARTPMALWDKWQKIGSYLENANRNAIYENAIKAGRSKKEAAYLARDLMDFSMHGSSQFVQFLSDVLPFFNARLQGLYKLYRQGGKRKLRKSLLMRAGTITLGTLALMAFNSIYFADGYDELEEWDKDTYWHIAPGTIFHTRIPKPFELGVLFATIPERIARAITYQVPGGDAGDRPRQTLDSFLTQIGGTLAMNPIPQGVMPIVEQWANKSFFTGRPIENMGDEKLLPEARAEWYTSDTAKVISDVIGNRTGMSPKRIEHLWNGYTGGIGAYLLETSDWIVRQVQQAPERPELAWAELPLIKRFYRGDMVPKNTRYMTDFYELKTKAEQVSGTIKEFEIAGRKDEAAELEAENAWLLGPRIRSNRAKAEFMHANVRKINKARDELADIRKQIEGIVAMPGFTDERKRREIDALAIKRNEIAREITRFLRSQERQSR